MVIWMPSLLSSPISMARSKKIPVDKIELEFLQKAILKKFQSKNPQHRIKVSSYKPGYTLLVTEMNETLMENEATTYYVSEGLLRDLFFNTQVKDSNKVVEEYLLSQDFLDACYLYLSDGLFNRDSFSDNLDEVPPLAGSSNTLVKDKSKQRSVILLGAVSVILFAIGAIILTQKSNDHIIDPNIGEDLSFFTANHQQLTNNGEVESTTIAPDGKSFAFISDGPADSTTLYIQNVGGYIPKVLYRWKNLQRSSHRWRNGLKWSKDGTLLCLRVYPLGDPQINLISRFGGTPTVVKDRVGSIFALSPNNSILASTFTNFLSLRLYDIAKGKGRNLPLKWSFEWIDEIEWAPNGKHILVCTLEESTFSLWEVGYPDGNCRKLLSDTLGIFTPRYANDGNTIYYKRPSGGVSEIVELNVDLSNDSIDMLGKVVYKGNVHGEISISDDGRKLIFCGGARYNNMWLGSLSNLDSIQNFTPITHGTLSLSSPRFSPNGDFISFVRFQNGKFLICLYNIPSKSTNILPIDTKGGDELVWSPDGQFMAFVSQENGVNHVSMVSIHSGKAKTFLNSHPGSNLHLVWAPDSLILYQMPEGDTQGFNFRFLDPESENESLLIPKGPFGYLFDPMVNRNFEMVATYSNSQEEGLWLFDLNGERKEFLLERAYPVKWAKDWRMLYAIDYRSQPCQLFKIDPFQNVILDTFDLPFKTVTDISISPDDSLVVLNVPEKSMDVWMLEKPE